MCQQMYTWMQPELMTSIELNFVVYTFCSVVHMTIILLESIPLCTQIHLSHHIHVCILVVLTSAQSLRKTKYCEYNPYEGLTIHYNNIEAVILHAQYSLY